MNIRLRASLTRYLGGFITRVSNLLRGVLTDKVNVEEILILNLGFWMRINGKFIYFERVSITI